MVKVTKNHHFKIYFAIGISSCYLSGLLVSFPIFEQIRLPVAFTFIGFCLGLYVAFFKERSWKTIFLIITSYLSLGFLYSFFFHLVVEKQILNGKTLSFNSASLWIITGSIAAAAFVYCFCIAFFPQKKDDRILISFNYIVFFLALLLIIASVPVFISQTILVHFLFLFVLTITIVNLSSSIRYKNNTLAVVYIVLFFPTLLLNYTITAAFLAIPAYFGIEKYLTQSNQLTQHQAFSARLFAFTAFVSHLLFLLIYDETLLENAAASGLLFVLFGSLTVYTLGYYLFGEEHAQII